MVPDHIFPKQKVNIEADVINEGGVKGNFIIPLLLNGLENDSRMLTLEAGQNGFINFEINHETPGDYNCNIGEMNASLKVIDAATYKSPDKHYSISYPVGWNVDDTIESQLKIGKIGAEIIVTNHTITETSFIEFVKNLNDLMLIKYGDWKILSEGDVQKDGNYLRCTQECSFTSEEGVSTKANWLIIRNGDLAWEVLGSASESVWDHNKSIIQASLNSFIPPVVVGDVWEAVSYQDNTHGYS